MARIWADLINPSHPLMLEPILSEFVEDILIVSSRNRAETASLSRSILQDITPIEFGVDDESRVFKELSIVSRTVDIFLNLPEFDASLSVENPIAVAVSKARGAQSILFCDNDLKYSSEKIFQRLENSVKSAADDVFFPKCCENAFRASYTKSRLHPYDGIKEDIYCRNHVPARFEDLGIPFEEYVVLRPESFSSLYVEAGETLVPSLLEELRKGGFNAVLVPRNPENWRRYESDDCFIPPSPVNGLDLIHYSTAVFTGSGTMAREAAAMGRMGVSFFPNAKLLSVDKFLVDGGHVLHSRDPSAIIRYLKRGDFSPYHNRDLSSDIADEVKDSIRH